MRKAGGIIGLIAGVFGVFAAFVTLAVGGMGSAFHADQASTVIYLGWGGLLFAFLTIVLGAVTIAARSKVPGALMIVCSISGAILGGTFVAIFMALSLVGGLLAILGGSNKTPVAAT
jgi:hypothetical protein